MKQAFTKFIAITAMSAGMVFAQTATTNEHVHRDPQAMIQRQIDHLASALSLTDAQKQQATTLFTNALQESKPIMQQMHAANKAVLDAAKANPADPQIETLAATAGNLNGQLLAMHAKAMGSLYTILTPQQRQQFDQLHGHGEGMMMPGAFGGPRH